MIFFFSLPEGNSEYWSCPTQRDSSRGRRSAWRDALCRAHVAGEWTYIKFIRVSSCFSSFKHIPWPCSLWLPIGCRILPLRAVAGVSLRSGNVSDKRLHLRPGKIHLTLEQHRSNGAIQTEIAVLHLSVKCYVSSLRALYGCACCRLRSRASAHSNDVFLTEGRNKVDGQKLVY